MENSSNVMMLKSGDLTLDNKCIVLSFSISDISENLKAELEKAIEQAKGADTRHMWSDKPVIMDFTYLRVVLEDGKEIDCSIHIGFHDSHDEDTKIWDCSLKVDLSEQTERLKGVILNMLVDALF